MSGADPGLPASPGSGTSAGPASWRSGRAAGPVLRHRWQRDWNAQPLELVERDLRWRRLRTIGLTITALGLMGALAVYLLYRPLRTPLIIVSEHPTASYAWPLTPLAGSREDVLALQSLGRETLEVSDLSLESRTRDRLLAALQRSIEQSWRRNPRTEAVIVYVSLHGAVNGEGVACLIPPGAQPLRAESWLKLDELLGCIKSAGLPSRVHKLLVLDVQRARVNWNLGVLDNTFSASVPQVVDAAQVPHLTVLCSARDGQLSWASDNLGGSVFGHYFALGLAGAADETAEGGNNDRRVALGELVRYLAHHVDRWVQANRADRQEPWRTPADGDDFLAAWATSSGWRRRNLQSTPSHDPPQPTVPASNLGRLWVQHDEMAARQPWRDNPRAWGELEQQLVWLEQASRAGAAYEAAAVGLYGQLSEQLGKALARVEGDAEAKSYRRRDPFTGRRTRLPDELSLHSLALAARFELVPADRAAQLTDKLQAFAAQPRASQLGSLLALDQQMPLWSEAHWPRLVDRWAGGVFADQPALVGASLRCRLMAEQTAAPVEAGVVPWLRAAAAGAERLRRQGEDQLLIATDESLTAAAQSFAQAEAAYGTAQAWSDATREATALRDRVWAELPWLAQWFCAPVPAGQTSEEIDQVINQTLLPLVDDLNQLAVVLAEGPADEVDSPAAGPPFAPLAQRVATGYQRLVELFDREIQRVLKSRPADPRVLRALGDLLDTPLVPARQREELTRLRTLVVNQSHRDYRPLPVGEASLQPADSAPLATYVDRMTARWQNHPMRAWLAEATGAAPRGQAQADTPSNEDSSEKPAAEANSEAGAEPVIEVLSPERQVAAWGEQIRRRLANVPAEVRRLGDLRLVGDAAAANASAPGSIPTPHTTWLGWNLADNLVRGTAIWKLEALDVDPAKRLRRLELEQLIAWQVARSLDDFLGPAALGESSFCDRAAADYLAAARDLFEPVAEVQTELAALEQLAQRRREAGRTALAVTAGDLLVVGQIDEVPVTIEVRTTSPAALADLPPGQPAVFLADAQGRIAGSSGSVQPVAERPAQIEFSLLGPELDGRGPVLDAVALWRGHAYRGSSLVRNAGGLRVDYKPFRYGPPRVMVGGAGRRQASVVFLLDCSQSMNELTVVESPQGNQPVTRLEAARAALEGMLRLLAQSGRDRVGVRLFGHRVGWDLERQGRLLQQTTYARPIPAGLVPSEDVERVLPLGRFDPIVAGGLTGLLDSVKPWGESPLYLALIEALGDFAGDNPDAERQIVVITDGANYQFNSPQPRNIGDVLAALNAQRVPIHIVGFEIEENEADQAQREFARLAGESGGSFATADNATSLVRSLENLLGPQPFYVEDAAGRRIGEAPSGQTVTIRPPPARAERYVVGVGPVREAVELSGGESLELALAPSGRYLETPRYDQGSPKFAPLTDAGPSPSTDIWLGVHRPLNAGSGVSFTFSFQNLEQRFLPRPAEVWLEVTPRGPQGPLEGPPFVFYDVNFEPERSVPVLRWQAEPWPLEARWAEVRVWCRPRLTPADHQLSLAEAAELSGVDRPGIVYDDLPGWSGRVYLRAPREAGQPSWVVVVERHAEDSPGLTSQKVEVAPRADRITHAFDSENRIAVHGFAYESTTLERLRDFQLRLTRLRSLQADAWQNETPVVVEIADGGQTLPLVAPQIEP